MVEGKGGLGSQESRLDCRIMGEKTRGGWSRFQDKRGSKMTPRVPGQWAPQSPFSKCGTQYRAGFPGSIIIACRGIPLASAASPGQGRHSDGGERDPTVTHTQLSVSQLPLTQRVLWSLRSKGSPPPLRVLTGEGALFIGMVLVSSNIYP